MVIQSSIKYLILFGLAFSGFSLNAAGAKKKPAAKVAAKPKVLTQTEAHQSMYKEDIEALLGSDREKYHSLIHECIANEKAYCNDCYVFYHAQKTELMILNDFLKELEIFLLKKPMKDFVYLRMPRGFTNDKTVSEFIDYADAQKSFRSWDDHQYRDVLLSCNLALFGNATKAWDGECTFQFFKYNANICPPFFSMYCFNIINAYQLNSNMNYSNIQYLKDKIVTESGNLVQIFVPKEMVNEVAYLSEAYGKPWRSPIASYFDHKRQCHTAIAPILDLYRLGSNEIPNMDELQARIVITRHGVLNPESGIKMKSINMIDPKTMAVYKKELKTIAGKITAVWVNRVKSLRKLTKDPYAVLTQSI